MAPIKLRGKPGDGSRLNRSHGSAYTPSLRLDHGFHLLCDPTSGGVDRWLRPTYNKPIPGGPTHMG